MLKLIRRLFRWDHPLERLCVYCSGVGWMLRIKPVRHNPKKYPDCYRCDRKHVRRMTMGFHNPLAGFFGLLLLVSGALAEPGDVTNDGAVTQADAWAVLEFAAGATSQIDSVAADVTGDGRVSALDASWILRRADDPTVRFPVEITSVGRVTWGQVRRANWDRRQP